MLLLCLQITGALHVSILYLLPLSFVAYVPFRPRGCCCTVCHNATLFDVSGYCTSLNTTTAGIYGGFWMVELGRFCLPQRWHWAASPTILCCIILLTTLPQMGQKPVPIETNIEKLCTMCLQCVCTHPPCPHYLCCIRSFLSLLCLGLCRCPPSLAPHPALRVPIHHEQSALKRPTSPLHRDNVARKGKDVGSWIVLH